MQKVQLPINFPVLSGDCGNPQTHLRMWMHPEHRYMVLHKDFGWLLSVETKFIESVLCGTQEQGIHWDWLPCLQTLNGLPIPALTAAGLWQFLDLMPQNNLFFDTIRNHIKAFDQSLIENNEKGGCDEK